MKTFKNIILILFLVIILAFIGWKLLSQWQASRQGENNEKNGDKAPIAAQFTDKIVYSTAGQINIKDLEDDCLERNGIFNECGSPCGPEADFCAEICAPVCELPAPDNNIPADEVKLTNYTDTEIGFSLDYPDNMQVEKNENQVVFTLWGPTQGVNTEFFDGISFTVKHAAYDQARSLEEVAREEIEEVLLIGEITAPLSSVTLDQKNGYTYSVQSAGSYTIILLPSNTKNFFMVSYSAPDPTNQGFNIIAEQMINSFTITSAGVDKTELKPVNNNQSKGTATRSFDGENFSHAVTAELNNPAEDKFYEGWLVKEDNTFFSTGKLEKKNGQYELNYQIFGNRAEYNLVVITEETAKEGLDNKPETHILEGKFNN